MPPIIQLCTLADRGIIFEYSAYLAAGLALQDFDVILQTGEGPEWPLDLPSRVTPISNFALPSRQVCYGSVAWMIDRYKLALGNAIQRLRLARDKSATIVHIQVILPWVDVLFIPLLRRQACVVCTVHDVVPHVFKLPSRLDLALRRQCYALADGLIFHSQANLEQFKRVYGWCPSNASVIPIGLTWRGSEESQSVEARTKLSIPQNSQVILMFGQIRPNKGLDVLIEAFSRIISEIPDAFLLIAGGAHPTVDTNALCAMLESLPPHTYRWEDRWISEEELEHCFRAATVVVLPYSTFGSQSGVLTKAYAYGRPLVVTDVGSLGESVRDDGSGLVVTPNDPAGLAKSLRRLLTDDTLRNEFECHVAQVAQGKYAWSNVSRLTARFYRSILRRGQESSSARTERLQSTNTDD